MRPKYTPFVRVTRASYYNLINLIAHLYVIVYPPFSTDLFLYILAILWLRYVLDLGCSEITYIAPSTNDVQEIVSTEGEIHDALVHGLAAPLGRQVFLCDLRPAQGSHGESDRLVPALGIRSGRIAPSSEMRGIIDASR